MNQEEVARKLAHEALEDRETGWLSDLSHFDLGYDTASHSITVGGWGSIDLGHLAEIVVGLIEKEATDGRR